MRKICIIPALLAVILALAACDLIDEISGKNNLSETVSVTGVLLNKTSTSLVVGGTETLFANIEPSNATNKNVTWISDNDTVATVTAGGLVTGVSSGTATIIVTTVDKGKTTFCTVTVGNTVIPVTGVLLNKTSTSLVVGNTETLFTAITPSNATNQSVTWSSGSPSVATVSAGGEITGVSAGTTTITVTTVDGRYQTACTVTIVNEGGPIPVFNGNRYQATPDTSTGNDKIKYSYRYNGLDFYYIYLGRLGNIPLYRDGAPYRHSHMYTSDEYEFKEVDETTISNTVTKSSQETVSVSNENTVSKTTEYKFHEEVKSGFKIFGIGTEVKFTADQNFKDYISNTSTFQQTTSLANTVEEGTSQTKSTIRGRKFTLTKNDREGFYRYTYFSVSDVYLYVVRDPAKPDEIYYEFRENIIPGIFFWDLDYSETPEFNKNDASKFEVDISILKNLPTPTVTLSDPVHPTGVSLNKTNIILEKGGIETLTATITPSDAANKNVTWSSSNTAVATVSTTGTVTAVSTGSAIISVKTEDGNLTAECNVTVSPPTTVYTYTRTDVQYVSDVKEDYKFDYHDADLDLVQLKAEGYKWVTIKLDFQIKHETTGYVGICIYSGNTIIRNPEEESVPKAWDSRSDFDIGSGGNIKNFSWSITLGINDFTNLFTVRWWAHGSGWDEYYLRTRTITVTAKKQL